ncbi:3'(2'),5'-bisphosphate nucleotidase [Salegentibacter echinorum]|uniref:3'(2'),5'-bisphosphate nucleotidase CysQ n=1 Tax=Salegentibacter echinorum TaxID=1073325 RepID=A0A1M5FH61_SALEC|nr:3'(2'),5'-bisphosphate nucleotidase CysQ [Salegentibacter echinorum]SHF90492.1 3'(2'),5'-bisphosphate nucleotidase [Salegentibacter echinorum]
MRKELEIAIKAAIAGGEEILQVYNSEEFHVEIKNDSSPLTIADTKANSKIMEFLAPTAIKIISEENRQIAYTHRKNWDACWIVDPLDGTKEFIKKNGEFTVNIALIKNGAPFLGVIYVPATGVLYYADVEKAKAYKTSITNIENFNSAINNSEVIRPGAGGKNLRVVGSKSHMNDDTLNYIKSLKEFHSKTVEIVPVGSSLKFCLVAEGLADVYPRFAPTMEWDTAAGHAICNAVGLNVVDKETGKEMRYNRENLLNNSFLVSAIG